MQINGSGFDRCSDEKTQRPSLAWLCFPSFLQHTFLASLPTAALGHQANINTSLVDPSNSTKHLPFSPLQTNHNTWKAIAHPRQRSRATPQTQNKVTEQSRDLSRRHRRRLLTRLKYASGSGHTLTRPWTHPTPWTPTLRSAKGFMFGLARLSPLAHLARLCCHLMRPQRYSQSTKCPLFTDFQHPTKHKHKHKHSRKRKPSTWPPQDPWLFSTTPEWIKLITTIIIINTITPRLISR